MNNSAESRGPAALEYSGRQKRRQEEATRLHRKHLALSNARLVTFLAGAVMLWLVFESHLLASAWLVLPVALFLGLVVIHSRVEEARDRARRGAAFYQKGLDRLNHRWQGKGDTGDRFREPEHPYAEDLDLFGEGSVFELLSTATTSAGGDVLASWLLQPASVEEVRSRQEAVEELRANIDLREELAVLAPELDTRVRADLLAQWSSGPRLLQGGAFRFAALGVTAIVVGATLAWLAGLLASNFFVLVLLGQTAFSFYLRGPVDEVAGGVDRPGQEVETLAKVLARLEQERFKTPLLVKLRASLDAEGSPPSVQAAALSKLVRRLDWRRNMIFLPFALLLMWATHLAFAVERWRARSGRAIPNWLKAVGEFEALCSLSGYAYEHPEDPFPELVEGERIYDGEGLGHLLIPEDDCVRNDLRLAGEPRLLVISGSNMSGKTTFLRTVGLNAVMAMAGAPVRARRLKLCPWWIGASIRIQDSIQAGRSRFYAEILRIRQIVELASNKPAVLFLLDEILHGTNSHDRRIGAEGVVKGLLKQKTAGLVTTHDLALAKIADELAPVAGNVHFEDHIEDGKIVFDYKKRDGVVEKSNAIALMRAVGLEV
jgi:hypothetical protein